MLRKDLDDLDTNGQVGDWCFLNERPEPDKNDHLPPLLIAIRYGEIAMQDTCIIPIARQWLEETEPIENSVYHQADGKPAWEWDGNREAPTLSPSILVHGGKGQPDQWHGWLRAGKLVTA
jgi:hypothetical protein